MPAPERRLRLATRTSPLALWQAHHVAGLLAQAHEGLVVQIVGTDTLGDRRQDVPISDIGGKGVFATEVQRLVLEGIADAAVHSAKDLPAVTGEGLRLAGVPERGDPRDALVGAPWRELPMGAVVATGSQRRRVQLADLRPDLRFVELRGNMATRLAKVGTTVEEGTVEAVIVAAAALERLELDEEVDEVLPVEAMVPQVGQGTLAVEVRAEDAVAHELVRAVEHAESRRRLEVERAFLAELGGDCDLPAGCHCDAPAPDGELTVRAVLADGDGRVQRAVATGTDGPRLGASLARTLRVAVEG